jgi:hypothetical protein
MTRSTINCGHLIQNATWLQWFTSLQIEWAAMWLLGESASTTGILKQNCPGLQARMLFHRCCRWRQCYKQEQITKSLQIYSAQNKTRTCITKWYTGITFHWKCMNHGLQEIQENLDQSHFINMVKKRSYVLNTLNFQRLI